MKLVAGLGNVGKDYDNTRHNAGFLAVRWLADRWQEQANWTQSKQQAVILKSQDKDVVLAQPTAMMNESGRAVRALMDYYKIPIKDVVIIHDDADLELGQLRTAKSTQTGGGHHGVLSVIEHIGPGFKRVRIGIGRPHQPVRDISGYVLDRLNPSDRQVLDQAFSDHLEKLIAG